MVKDRNGPHAGRDRTVAQEPIIRAFFDEPTNTVSYLVADPATRRAAVIDPVFDDDPNAGEVDTRSVDANLKAANEAGYTIVSTLETHTHEGSGRGKRGPARAPGTGPGKRVPGAGPRTGSRKTTEEGEVHRALPPSHPSDAPDRPYFSRRPHPPAGQFCPNT